MFDFTSRYARQEVAAYFAPNGSEISYARRRWLPAGAALPLLAEVTFQSFDRLDLVTYRALANPLQYWRVADANDALNPFDLEVPGRVLRVPVPQP